MRPIVRLATALVVALVVAVGLWLGLELGAGADLGTASAVAIGSATFIITVGIALVAIPVGSDHPSNDGNDDSTLKGVTNTFADRVDEWEDVQAIVRRFSGRKRSNAAIMIYGAAGGGKTEFATFAAQELFSEFNRYARRRHLKPVAHLIELRGAEGLSRKDPRDLLHYLLDRDGLDPRRAKMELGELSAEWRRSLQGKFAVLFLDNAVDADQVEPFIPGKTPYILLVTSRGILADLIPKGVTPYRLKVLPEAGAVDMIRNLIDRPFVEGEQEAAARIAALCEYNPEEIRIALSARARKRNDPLIARLAELEVAPKLPLIMGKRGNGGAGDGEAPWFNLSYMQSSDEAKLVLRRLTLAPVPDIGVEAAAALANLTSPVVHMSLRELADAALLEEADEDRLEGASEGPATYQMHDLVRYYAQSLVSPDERQENRDAVDRLLAYYWAAAEFADVRFTRQRPPEAIEPPRPSVSHGLTDLPSVTRWVRRELSNLLACADYAVRQAEGNDDRDSNAWVVLFASALAGILRNESQWRRSIELQTRAIECSQNINVPLGMANALSERGLLRRLTSELEWAEADLEQAITIYSGVGGAEAQRGMANALNTLGVVVDQRDRKDEARRRLGEALDIYRRLGDELGEANVLQDQGMTEFFADNYDQAMQLMGRALALYTTKHQPLGMSHASFYLARAQRNIGDETGAEKSLESARSLYHDLGNKLGESNVLVQLGAVLRARDPGLAVSRLSQLVELSAEIGNQMTRMAALDLLGDIHLERGDREAAREAWSRGLLVAREYGVRRDETKFAGKVRQVR